MTDDEDRRAISGINEWQGKLKYRSKSTPVPPCTPHIPYDFNRVRTGSSPWEAGDSPPELRHGQVSVETLPILFPESLAISVALSPQENYTD
jgi:hypothetical protein